MHAQLFLGLYMLVQGVSHFFNLNYFFRYNEKDRVDKDRLASYRKGLAIAYFWLGVLFIIMGLVEKYCTFSAVSFSIIYIVLSIPPLVMLKFNYRKISKVISKIRQN